MSLFDLINLADSTFLGELLAQKPRNSAEARLHAAVIQARDSLNDPSNPDFSKPPPAVALTRTSPFSRTVVVGASVGGASLTALDVSGYGFQISPGGIPGVGSNAQHIPPSMFYPIRVDVTSLLDNTVETLFVTDSSYFPCPNGFKKLSIGSMADPSADNSLLLGSSATFYVDVLTDPSHDLQPGLPGVSLLSDFPAFIGGHGTHYLDFDSDKNGGNNAQTAGAGNSPANANAGFKLDGVSAVLVSVRAATPGATFAGAGSILYWYYNAFTATWHRKAFKGTQSFAYAMGAAVTGLGSISFEEEQFVVKQPNDRFYAEASNVTMSAGNVAVHLTAVRY